MICNNLSIIKNHKKSSVLNKQNKRQKSPWQLLINQQYDALLLMIRSEHCGFLHPCHWFFEKVVQVFYWIFFWFGGRAANIMPCVTHRTHFTLLLRKKWRSWSSWSGLVAIHCLLAASIVSWRWLTRLVAVPETRTNRDSPWGWVVASHPLEWKIVVSHWAYLAPRGFSRFFLGLIF